MGRHKRALVNGVRIPPKGCNCKRSACLKNYCDCYEAKVRCSSLCKCTGCRNVENRDDVEPPKPAPPLPPVTTKRITAQQFAAQVQSGGDDFGKMFEEEIRVLYGFKNGAIAQEVDKTRPPFLPADDPDSTNLLTTEAINEIISSLIQQAADCEQLDLNRATTEEMILTQFGDSLEQFYPLLDRYF